VNTSVSPREVPSDPLVSKVVRGDIPFTTWECPHDIGTPADRLAFLFMHPGISPEAPFAKGSPGNVGIVSVNSRHVCLLPEQSR